MHDAKTVFNTVKNQMLSTRSCWPKRKQPMPSIERSKKMPRSS